MFLQEPSSFQKGEIDRNRLPRRQLADDLSRFSLVEAKFQLPCQCEVELLQDLETQPTGAVTHQKRDPVVSPKLLLRFRVIVQIDEDVGVNEDAARSCNSSLVGRRPSTHSSFRGFLALARKRSIAISYSSSLRLISSINSASHFDMLRFCSAARTRSQSAMSSLRVTVTFFIATKIAEHEIRVNIVVLSSFSKTTPTLNCHPNNPRRFDD